MRRVKLAPSLLNADFSDLRGAVAFIEGIADLIHLDVMDGNFVPNITFGPLVVKAVRSITDLPLDVHLMIAHPAEFVEDFVAAGADWVSFHAEVTRHPGEILGLIHSLERKAGVVVNPQTPAERLFEYLELMDFVLVMTVMPGFGGQAMIPEALQKVGQLKEEAARRGLELEVEVDGGVKTENLEMVLQAGTDVVVVGSSIYAAPDPGKAAAEIRSILDRT
ncbi:MAG: ribulose-phosphate 3-epimerase [Actinomycetota bacterium]|nr:ribulose-phosphate 3-epimerase [Actinomycetota bacterium]MDD5667912.1 ribulose-phosphate 3-epimerase [Actinomycetota bacterium]